MKLMRFELLIIESSTKVWKSARGQVSMVQVIQGIFSPNPFQDVQDTRLYGTNNFSIWWDASLM